MCYHSRKTHLCILCLLVSSFISGVNPSPQIEDGHKHAKGESGHLDQLKEVDKNDTAREEPDMDIFMYSDVTVEYFLDELMKKYGNGEVMMFEGFEHLLAQLNLADMVFMDHTVECHKRPNSSEFITLHSNHNHSGQATVTSSVPCFNQQNKHLNHDDHDHGDHSGHDHSDHSGHDHSDHSGHDHSDHSSHDHGDHSGHDHSDNEHEDHLNHNHTEHSNHNHTDDLDQNHGDHSGHDHGDHSGHDHGDHSGHDHSDHSGHDHEDHSDHDHDNHLDHDHGDHSDHDHGDHLDHDHGDHSDHDHSDHSDNEHNDHDEDHDHASHNELNDEPEGMKKQFLTYRKKRSAERSINECLPPKMLLSLVKKGNNPGLTRDMFVRLCPALIYQIDANKCAPFHDDHDGHDHGDHDGHDHGDYDGYDHSDHDHNHGDHDHLHDDHEFEPLEVYMDSSHTAKVWGFSTLAVVVISLAGFVGVAVVPIIEKEFYNHLLQFLVASAVGALAGDALLHLLPHAIAGGHSGEAGGHDHSSHGHGSHDHDLTPIYKGLCGLFGIYFFFLTERLITIVTDMKRRKKKRNRKQYTEAALPLDKVGARLADSDNKMECTEVMMSIHPNRALQGYADEAHSEHCAISFENTTTISHEHGHTNNKVDEGENVSMISDHEHGHGHSHFKGGMPSSVSALAWMLIMGDAIHNLSDGMAIGAAFANSITGGFSTSIAVFFHELPHEIGDFAVLLRAGMSPKQAIIYSSISSIFCFVGMCIGVALGNIQNASLWIFAVVGGMFLYIALVDMLPELSSVATKKGENPFFHLILQLLGMLLGGGIMLIIALYEENLMNILE